MSIIIGLTGPTGAGKSKAARVAGELGLNVIDCDKVARKAVEKGTGGLCAVAKAFGEGVLENDGTLNRKALAKAAFSSKEKTELLNKTLLPFITELVKREITDKITLLDAPTLFESGMDSICDYTVAVLADTDIRKKRIMERDLITESEATLRMSAGKSDEFYLDNADFTVYNNGSAEDFLNQIVNVFNGILKGDKNG